MPLKTRPPAERSFIVSCIALKKDLSHKDIGGKIGWESKEVSRQLREGPLKNPVYQQFLEGVEATPADVAVATACYLGLEPVPGLTDAEREVVELELLEASREYRQVLVEAVLCSRAVPPWNEYPKPEDVEPARWRAAEQVALLKDPRLKDFTETERAAVARLDGAFRNWAFAELAAEESVEVASRDLEEAAWWTRLAVDVAEEVEGPEGWCKKLRGFAEAHSANILKAAGKLKKAEAAFEKAKALWAEGSDPDQVLDPGRLLDLEASLRLAQRHFDEALDLLERAQGVSRRRARTLISKGTTLEAMGEYNLAIEALLEAEPLLNRHTEPRLWYKLSFNLSVNYCHLGRHGEAAESRDQAREIALDLGDEIFLVRIAWLSGRIAAGLGQPDEAHRLLEQAQREFATREMWYDVALALLERGALLLGEGRLRPGPPVQFMSPAGSPRGRNHSLSQAAEPGCTGPRDLHCSPSRRSTRPRSRRGRCGACRSAARS